jgi:hypothetical protein
MTEERITSYLLQELTEEEAGRFEEQCFAQEEWPAELDSAEQDLIDAYLSNELSKDRRLRFEKNYLTTDARKARVLTAQSFHKVLPSPSFQHATFWEKLQVFWRRPLVPQAAVAILVLGISIAVLAPFFMRAGRSPQTFTRLDLAMSSSNRAVGVQPEKVILPLPADALEIHLKLPEQSTNTAGYRVHWENVSGSLGDLAIASQDAQSVVVVIPASKLSPGQYVLKLFRIKDGTEQPGNGSYYFNVEEAARTR